MSGSDFTSHRGIHSTWQFVSESYSGYPCNIGQIGNTNKHFFCVLFYCLEHQSNPNFTFTINFLINTLYIILAIHSIQRIWKANINAHTIRRMNCIATIFSPRGLTTVDVIFSFEKTTTAFSYFGPWGAKQCSLKSSNSE